MLTIGQVSAMFDLPVSTLRHYDKERFAEVMSSAGWSNWDDVSLLTDRHILRTDNSAIARMSEDEVVANEALRMYRVRQ